MRSGEEKPSCGNLRSGDLVSVTRDFVFHALGRKRRKKRGNERPEREKRSLRRRRHGGGGG